MLRSSITSFLLFITISWSFAQDLDIFAFRPVGPSRGGRVTAVAGASLEPGTFYFGATGGGVWKTTDFGEVWENISDGFFSTPSIGAISVFQKDPNIIYVGTGSDGLRSNVIIGKGVYKSIDAGRSWEFIGLPGAGQIGAVEIHPDNHNIVYVAAIGNPFAPNEQRGVFKTIDGGKSWQKVLYISDKVGAADLELLPGNPEILYASMWRAERKPWTIISGGKEGGIYKSVNGGKDWEKLGGGLPEKVIGKVDLAVTPADSRILYALVEAAPGKRGLYKSQDQGKTFELINEESGLTTRPFYYTNVEVDPNNPDRVYIMATGNYVSYDGGKSFERLNSPHSDNHDIWINPNNSEQFIQSNDGGANITHNGGQTWSTQFNQPTAELYQVEVDDQYPYWLYAGQQDNYSTISVPSMAPYGIQTAPTGWIINTGGCETGPAVPKPGDPNIVYSNCKGRFSVYNKATGVEQRYDVGARYMYGHNPGDLKFRFQRVSPIHVSPHDPSVIYHCSQYVHKTTDEGNTWEIISPDLTAFEEDKQVISGEPLTRDITGEEFYSTIYAIRESPLTPGVIWVGANDGPVHVTKDGGENWTNVTPGKLPEGGRVDAVEPSPHDPAKAYIAVLRYQLGDFRPYIYRTTDYGKSWSLLTSGENGIPGDYPCRVVREDPNREGLLYAGTEFGLFISFDDGDTWKPFQNELPVTPVSDIKIHRDDLVISTMGRGFYILDNLTTLRHSDFISPGEEPVLFPIRDTYRYFEPSVRYPDNAFPVYPGPALHIDYYLPEGIDEEIVLEIYNQEGGLLNRFLSGQPAREESNEDMALNEYRYQMADQLVAGKGFHRFEWDMRRFGPWHTNERRRYSYGPPVAPGTFQARLIINNDTITQEVDITLDPRMIEQGISVDDASAQEELAVKITELLSETRQLIQALEEELKQLKGGFLNEDQKKRQTAIEDTLDQLVTAQGTYMQPMLEDQIGYLYYIVNGPYQRPGRDAYHRYRELKDELESIKAGLDTK